MLGMAAAYSSGLNRQPICQRGGKATLHACPRNCAVNETSHPCVFTSRSLCSHFFRISKRCLPQMTAWKSCSFDFATAVSVFAPQKTHGLSDSFTVNIRRSFRDEGASPWPPGFWRHRRGVRCGLGVSFTSSGETESGSAGTQPDKRHSGQRCTEANHVRSIWCRRLFLSATRRHAFCYPPLLLRRKCTLPHCSGTCHCPPQSLLVCSMPE